MSTTVSSCPRPRTRRRLGAVVSSCALVCAGLVALAAAPASAAGVCAAPVVTATTTTITCTAGGTGSLTVPADVSFGRVVLDGAAGGAAADNVPGGKGAHVEATLAVTPGATLNVVVGTRGGRLNGYAGSSGLGGGLVAVTDSGGTPLLTAGSGGGAGGPGIATPAFPGTPGADSGAAGSAGAGDSVGGGGGGGGAGTATAGGAGGTGASAGQTPGSSAGNPGGWPNAAGGFPSPNIYFNAGYGGQGGAGHGSGGAGGGGGVNYAPGGGQTGGAGGSGGGGSSLVSATVPGSPSSITDGVNTGDGLVVFTFPNPKADIDVDVTAQPHLGILVPYLTYTLTANNTGPDAVTSATLTATLPTGATATDLAPGCTATTGTVTCSYGAIANGSHASKSFRVPLHLLSLGQVSVTGTRTASTPPDPNPANDSATATCTVVSLVLAVCP
ncbi:DUF11 domain-containing protein [Embleya hyalina]|uniref:DUF11 domain-containing protein n=1 Tax=Embleya hyalina TaxID=516124 RepID=A0A401Z6Z4_9ACTN|nr:DUF11 domain-containing protein [Embleya hyalina]GCE02609.1 hypothetical protein EHYA_10386 [Embleya hyalina]